MNVEHHVVDVNGDSDKVACTHGDLTLDCSVWGRATAKAVAHAHAANPRATTEMLLEFVGAQE